MQRCRSTRTAGGFRWAWDSFIRLKSTSAVSSVSTASSGTAEPPRINPVGIQYLSRSLDKQVFPSKSLGSRNDKSQSSTDALTDISRAYLNQHGLLGKKTDITTPLNFKMPDLEGDTLDDHFRRLAIFASEPYIDGALSLAHSELPPRPQKFEFVSGWMKYTQGGKKPIKVDYPDSNALVFDVETQYKVSKYALMAVAASKDAWYVWVSPKLTGESDSYDHLIPMNTLQDEKVIVGHNVGYDRARVAEEYNLAETKAFFLDTMSLHIAVSGMCSRQRARWMEHRKLKNDDDTSADELEEFEVSDPWVKSSSPNSLADVAQFYFEEKLDKGVRDSFTTEDIDELRNDFQNLVSYCANDVFATHRVYSKVLPEFLKESPHPVSFAALRFMGAGILPTNEQWDDYIHSAETMYQESRAKIEKSLCELAETAVALRDTPEKYQSDPWLSQLDWSSTPLKLTKKGEPYKNQKLPGYPEWYKELYIAKENRLDITIRARITPILLKLTWEDCPVVWHDMYGWCFKAPSSEYERLKAKNYVLVPAFEATLGKKKLTKSQLEKAEKEGDYEKLEEHEQLELITRQEKAIDAFFETDLPESIYFRIPNSVGPLHRTTLLLAKSFTNCFEKGLLKSDNPVAQEALSMNASCSYWISARERIMSQFVVKNEDSPCSFILPQVVTMGTVTRRAVEKTWLTASNAKKSRIGSELKSKVIAPPGYCFVGADVDSEELWIASLVGDSLFGIHGGTAIGWMTLEGSKSEGTDLHSKTANILGISRNEAKIFNYGRIYGAGVKFATSLLKKFNPELTDDECTERAKALYIETKGQAGYYHANGKSHKIWYGGSESVLFNELERIAHQEHPKTPVLGASITRALMKKNLNANSFLTSRVNWAIQSSGVDYLHLLCVSMNYLIKKYGIHARLSLSVHDEIRYLVKEEDKYRAAMALQISNIWTRAIFSENLGMKDLPQSCAFFSAVDIDHILRKEVDMDCITPSNKTAVEPGESLNIAQLLEHPGAKLLRGKMLRLKKNIALEKPANDVEDIDVVHATPADLKFSLSNPIWKETYLKMQTVTTEKEFKSIFSAYKKNSRSLLADSDIFRSDYHDVIKETTVKKNTKASTSKTKTNVSKAPKDKISTKSKLATPKTENVVKGSSKGSSKSSKSSAKSTKTSSKAKSKKFAKKENFDTSIDQTDLLESIDMTDDINLELYNQLSWEEANDQSRFYEFPINEVTVPLRNKPKGFDRKGESASASFWARQQAPRGTIGGL
ncbi:CYFA0S02e11188g1_1 [Cyberlindnera fabianii]|uniref:DNA polymerase gamma n=1 Tax=Cyberlindnera fabianii TaxID=36022 RepID=A0A061AWG1_CYBFA|nr:CYFA0S02e11188g1_1 [Cyberlindnera fabianii]